jgi:hypothetical protein
VFIDEKRKYLRIGGGGGKGLHTKDGME